MPFKVSLPSNPRDPVRGMMIPILIGAGSAALAGNKVAAPVKESAMIATILLAFFVI